MFKLSKVLVVIGLVLVNVSLTQAKEFKPPEFSDFQKKEMYWLAKGIYFESRGEAPAGQVKVGEVILNRMIDSRWPKTIEKGVRQGEKRRHRGQFCFLFDGKPDKVVNLKAWQLAVDIAYMLYWRYTRGETGETCAHSYYAEYATNISYFSRLEREEQVGAHIFFCD